MKLALISDLHANLQALDAVLADIAAGDVDHTVCLGDVVDLGPEPGPVIRRLRNNSIPCLMGNHDPFEGEAIIPIDVYQWTRERLSSDELSWLRALPKQLEFSFGAVQVLCVHGSPRSFDEQILASNTDAELEAMVSGLQFDVLACGHTHVQLSRRLGRRTIVNAGSVGMPFEAPLFGSGPPRVQPWSEYAVLTFGESSVSVDLRRVDYDIDAYFESVRSNAMPDPEAWISIWLSPERP